MNSRAHSAATCVDPQHAGQPLESTTPMRQVCKGVQGRNVQLSLVHEITVNVGSVTAPLELYPHLGDKLPGIILPIE